MPITGVVNQSLVDQAVAATADPNASNNGTSFDPNMFLKILMSQLQNQNPFDTVDTSEIVQQQAILTQVEQATKQSQATESLRSDVAQNFIILNQTLQQINSKL